MGDSINWFKKMYIWTIIRLQYDCVAIQETFHLLKPPREHYNMRSVHVSL